MAKKKSSSRTETDNKESEANQSGSATKSIVLGLVVPEDAELLAIDTEATSFRGPPMDTGSPPTGGTLFRSMPRDTGSPPSGVVLGFRRAPQDTGSAPSGVVLGFRSKPRDTGSPPSGVILGFRSAPVDSGSPPSGTTLGFVHEHLVPLGTLEPDGSIKPIDMMEPQEPPSERAEPTGDGKQVLAWQDDPGTGFLVERDVPSVDAQPLGFEIRNGKRRHKQPKPGIYPVDTPGFRYWTAAEALRRASDFWVAVITACGKQAQWHPSIVGNAADGEKTAPALLTVKLDVAQGFNAYYDRKALNFLSGETPFGTVYPGESPDIVCHELGHAVLDGLRPELWGASSHEAAAFHEMFADCSALCAALQLPEVRLDVLASTGNRVYMSSRVSRLASELGAAIRMTHPQDVESDCLRNIANSFTYLDPLHLPHFGPASQLTSEPHSLARVLSGAWFEGVAAIFQILRRENDSAKKSADDDQLSGTLDEAVRIAARHLVTAVINAPVVSNYFAQIAAEIINAANAEEHQKKLVKGCGSAWVAVFVRRSILSLETAMTLPSPEAREVMGLDAAQAQHSQELQKVSFDVRQFGVDLPLLVETASQQRRYGVRASATDASPIHPASALTAAAGFSNDLLRRGRIGPAKRLSSKLSKKVMLFNRSFVTHELTEQAGGKAASLERKCFDCGLSFD